MWSSQLFFHALKDTQARRLIAAAEFLEKEHRARLSVPNPYPHRNSSKPGEYARMRTGRGRAGLTHSPQSIPEVINTQSVAVEFRPEVDYMILLEEQFGRLGINRTIRDLKGKIEDIMARGKV